VFDGVRAQVCATLKHINTFNIMIAVSTNTGTQAVYRGIKVRTETGKPAKVYENDTPIAVTATTGEGTGTVENVREYTEGDRTGTMFDVRIQSTVAGASVLNLTADADGDEGEVRSINLEFNLTTTEEEAAGFEVPEVVIEPIA
jgi:hypothetical protein